MANRSSLNDGLEDNINQRTPDRALVGNTWYDAGGNLIKQLPAGSSAFTKNAYDGVKRLTTRYVGYDLGASESNYASASDVSDDTIMEQTEMLYDAASNLIQTTSRQRFHNATGTGQLTAPGGTQPQARVTYVAPYPDAIGRPQATVNYGTNGDVTLDRSATIPASSDTVLVSSTLYNSRGEAYQAIDPAGTVTQTIFDDAGRQIEFIENYRLASSSSSSSTSSSSSSSSSSGLPVSDDTNRTTQWTYTADDKVATLTAINSATGNQTTTYNYGTTLTTSDIARNDLVASVVYPDSTSDKVAYFYNRQGQVKQLTDQRGVVHVYDFDLLGRLIHDRVTSFTGSSSSSSGGGAAVDSAVQRIERTYEVRGMLASVTNYDSPAVGSGNIVTQVQFSYNTFGQLASEYDNYAQAFMSATTSYAYADGSANTIRRTSMTYPNGRVLNYSYGASGSMDDALGRIASLIDSDGVTHLADYTRLGLGSFVGLTYATPQVAWSLINGTGNDPYTGLDQFNRVVDNRWYSTATSSSSSSGSSSSGGNSSSADLDRIQHGYDRASNRLWRKNTVAEAAGANLDELYAYDGLHRLADLQRGELNSSNNGIVSGTLDFWQAWGLDALGNWRTAVLDDSQVGYTVDNRTHNGANEITNTMWGTVAYDAAGNTTTFPNDVDSSYSATYDAWNRMAMLTGHRLTYDGLGRLAAYSTGYTCFYSDRWQLLETRYYSPTQVQYIWGLRYIDDLVFFGTTSGYFALQDANWNMSAVVDKTGAVQERYAYSAYGQPMFYNANFSLTNGNGFTSVTGCDVLFAGYIYFIDGLYLVRNRWHPPLLGRWLTRDPAGMALGSNNLYAYADSQPSSSLDPFGLQCWKPYGTPSVSAREFRVQYGRLWRQSALVTYEVGQWKQASLALEVLTGKALPQSPREPITSEWTKRGPITGLRLGTQLYDPSARTYGPFGGDQTASPTLLSLQPSIPLGPEVSVGTSGLTWTRFVYYMGPDVYLDVHRGRYDGSPCSRTYDIRGWCLDSCTGQKKMVSAVTTTYGTIVFALGSQRGCSARDPSPGAVDALMQKECSGLTASDSQAEQDTTMVPAGQSYLDYPPISLDQAVQTLYGH